MGLIDKISCCLGLEKHTTPEINALSINRRSSNAQPYAWMQKSSVCMDVQDSDCAVCLENLKAIEMEGEGVVLPYNCWHQMCAPCFRSTVQAGYHRCSLCRQVAVYPFTDPSSPCQSNTFRQHPSVDTLLGIMVRGVRVRHNDQRRFYR